jgi:hypothetical protein
MLVSSRVPGIYDVNFLGEDTFALFCGKRTAIQMSDRSLSWPRLVYFANFIENINYYDQNIKNSFSFNT